MMDLQRVDRLPPLTQALAKTGAFAEAFTLLDVGASGGIAPVWYAFGEALVAYAFDPIVAEIERLEASKPAIGRVRYLDAYLDGPKAADAPNGNAFDPVWARSSAQRASTLGDHDYIRERFGEDGTVRYSAHRFSIDQFCAREDLRAVDFIKIDADVPNVAILDGARQTLAERGVIGVLVEVNFNGSTHPQANSFANNDQRLRALGFALFDIDVRRYTRAALPGRFRTAFPGDTVTGQPCQADVLYVRDFGDAHARKPSTGTVLKTIAIFEIFGLYDCAVELLNVFAEDLRSSVDVEQLQSFLCEAATGVADYAGYVHRFEDAVRARRYGAFL